MLEILLICIFFSVSLIVVEDYSKANYFIKFSLKNEKEKGSLSHILYLICFCLVFYVLSVNISNTFAFISLVIYTISIIAVINIRYYIVNKVPKSIYDLLKYIAALTTFTIAIYGLVSLI